MAKKAISVGVISCAFVTLLCLAAAGGPNFNGKLAVHLKAHGTSCTEGFPVFDLCDDIVFTYPGIGDIDLIPVYYDMVEYMEVGFTLWWPTEWGPMSWVRCRGDAATGTLLNPGDHTHITWTSCQWHWSEAPGYGWVHATGWAYLGASRASAVDCGNWWGYPVTDEICCTWSGVGGMVGDDACRPFDSEIEETSWGAIRSMFK